MLRIFPANRQEALLLALRHNLKMPATDNPLVAEVIVAERGMDRWLWQALANDAADGSDADPAIAANLDMQLPAGFVWKTLRGQFSTAQEKSPFESASLVWRLLSLLEPAHLQDADFAPLRHYLADDPGQRKRHQLAVRLAGLYDQYLVYRHEMILRWEQRNEPTTKSADEIWQMRLWRQLVARAGHDHRAQLLQQFFTLAEAGKLKTEHIPARVSVFAVPALPPVYVRVLAALGAYTNIDIYALNPCAEFWGDALQPRALAQHFAQYGEAAALHCMDENGNAGNVLLANGGARIQQYFLDLLEHDLQPAPELFIEPAGDDLLARVQRDIFHNRAPAALLPDDIDNSLQVHGCYSLLREIEVLHDNLLEAFKQDDSLQPHEVLVLTPDINIAAPYIDAVFGSASSAGHEHNRHIPYTITDLARRAEHPLAAALRQLLTLAESRLTASDVLGLLETAALARRCGVDEKELDALRRQVADAGIRWGLDGSDRAARGLPAEQAHTWQFGMQRLFVGLTVPDDAQRLSAAHAGDVIAPAADLEGSDGVALGKLQTFVDRLATLRRQLSQPRSAADWRALMARMLADFCTADDADEERVLETFDEALRDFFDDVALAEHAGDITPEVFRADIEARLEQPAARGGLLRGAVTFAQLTPARSMPYRVVCLIGMNHDRFPHTQTPTTFDLVAAQPRRGDRSRRDDDRHLFLETLLCARDCFYISYTDRSLRDSSPQQPSVVVSELLDAITGAQTDPEIRKAISQKLLVQHPLQPFSRRQYDGSDARLFSYDPDWLPAAAAGSNARNTAASAFCPQPLLPGKNSEDADGPRDIRLSDLLRCLQHPARWFLEQRLGVYLRDSNRDELEDDEPFALPDSFSVNDGWIAAALAGSNAEEHHAWLAACGVTAQGAFARLDWQQRVEKLAPLIARLAEDDRDYQPFDIDITLPDGRRLHGQLAAVAGNRQRLFSSVETPHARLLLQAWIQHLCLCVMQTGTARIDAAFTVETVIETVSGTTTLQATTENPLRLLATLVDLFDQAWQQPLRLFPKSAYAYAKALAEKGDVEARRAAALRWHGSRFTESEPESADRALQTCFGHEREPLNNAEFDALATTVFSPLLHAIASGTEAVS